MKLISVLALSLATGLQEAPPADRLYGRVWIDLKSIDFITISDPAMGQVVAGWDDVEQMTLAR